MNIRYAVRSKFSPACLNGIASQREALDAGRQITISLGSGGYPGSVSVTINPVNANEFDADWAAKDLTRFPARIKAAATALRDSGCSECFAVSYTDSVLSIQKL